jgi:thiamine biosynthesis lipoprotein
MNSEHKASRRDFLKGRAVADKLRDATAPDEAQPFGGQESEQPQASHLIQISRRAMAAEFEVFLDAVRYKQNTGPAVAALELVEQLEDQMTVYREHSEVMDINRQAADRPVRVEPRLFGLLQLAVQLHTETEGAFDITSGPLSKVWGFYRRRGKFPDQEALAMSLQQVGTKWIELDEGSTSIRFLKRGVEMNLNAIGKGYALDRCAEVLHASGVDDFLIHGGQSSILAHGSRRSADDEPTPTGWRVALRHPLRRGQRVAEIRLQDRGLGTSGTGTQFFHHKGRRYGHVLDPRTGWPSEGVYSATALAPSGALADALSTAFYVMGRDKVEQYCEAHSDVSAVLVCPGERSGSIELVPMNLDDDQWERLE